MAELESKARKAKDVGSLRVPHPQEAKIRRQNAERVARRAQAATMHEQIQQVSGQDLSREGDPRKVGGRFEKLQKVPKRKAAKQAGLGFEDIAKFLKSLSFDPRESEYFRQAGFTSTGGAEAPRLAQTPGFTRQIISPF
jgi:hypothetical protein